MMVSYLGRALAFISLLSLVSSCCFENSCTCEPNCWEKCFMNPPDSQKNAYLEIYRMAIGIRNLYAPCFKPHGTAYMMDSNVPSGVPGVSPFSLFFYQRQLASIVAMVQPVGDDCNPFCTSKYYRNFAWYAHSWPCKSRCEAHKFFTSDISMQSFQANQQQQSPSWVGGGEILSRLCFDAPHPNGHECMNCTKNELLIAFTNSPMWTFPPGVCGGDPYHCAAVGTGTANWNNMDTWADSGPAYHLPHDVFYRAAARAISDCMKTQCCDNSTPNNWWTLQPVKGRSIDSEDENSSDRAAVEDNFSYLDSGNAGAKPPNDGKVKEFKGTFTDFKRKVLDREAGGNDKVASAKNGKTNKGAKVPRG